MLKTKVSTTTDPTLPLRVPQFPNPLDYLWLADSVLTDGDQIVPPVKGSISLTDGSGGATTLPTESTVDGLRAFTFNGTDDAAFALGANAGPGGSVSGYAVVKVTSDPGAARSIIHLSTFAMGFNSARKFSAGSAVLASTFNVGQWYVVGWSVERNTGTGDAKWRVAASTGESAEVLSQNQAALSTYLAFGVGASSVKTAMVARAFGAKIGGAAHTKAQLLDNIAVFKSQYGI